MADITIGIVLFVVFAGLLAAIIRNRDIPVSTAAISPFLITFGGSLIAAAIATWMLVDANSGGDTDAFNAFITLPNFLAVTGTAIGGLAFVQTVLSFVPGTAAYESRKAIKKC
jgi:hypothetical protein